MKIFKSYGFWTTFAGVVVILVNALGELFGFAIESKLIENVIMAVAGVLVALGIVSMNGNKDNNDKLQNEEDDNAVENQNEQQNNQQ